MIRVHTRMLGRGGRVRCFDSNGGDRRLSNFLESCRWRHEAKGQEKNTDEEKERWMPKEESGDSRREKQAPYGNALGRAKNHPGFERALLKQGGEAIRRRNTSRTTTCRRGGRPRPQGKRLQYSPPIGSPGGTIRLKDNRNGTQG